jgi:hypothetical protein
MGVKIWILNLVLIGLVVFSAFKIYKVWVQREDVVIQEAARRESTSVEPPGVVEGKMPPESTYKNVVDKNLFSPDRAEYLPDTPPIDEEVSPEEKAPEIKPLDGFGKKITLYGVLITDDQKMALISNPERKRGAPKDMWVKSGDSILEVKQRSDTVSLKVEEILKDRLIVNDGGTTKYEVLLYDAEKTQEREVIEKEAEVEVVGGEEKPPKEPKKARPKAPPKAQQEAPPEEAAEILPQPEAVESPAQQAPKDEYEVINTPFGEIKRRVRTEK